MCSLGKGVKSRNEISQGLCTWSGAAASAEGGDGAAEGRAAGFTLCLSQPARAGLTKSPDFFLPFLLTCLASKEGLKKMQAPKP